MIEGISAVTLGTHEMGQAVRFYRALGFEVLHGDEDSAFTSFRAGTSYLNLIAQPAERRWSWWGRVIFHVADVDALCDRALAAGYQPTTVPHNAEWGERFFHLVDPDGHELSFARPLVPVPVGNLIRLAREAESRNASVMREAYNLVWSVLVPLFRSRVSLQAEILILRHQLNIQRRHQPKRLAFSAMDRLIFVGLYRLVPNTIKALTIVKPDTVLRWHRAGFRWYWRWKSRLRCGRPAVPLEIRRLIREISIANPLWGAPRIYGELLRLGIDIGQTSVAKYMARRRGPPSQGWKTFLRNHADGIVAMDLFVVPTISFRLLYGLLIMGHGRRQILWFGVTAHPTAEWIANQLTEACGWEQIPCYLIRDRDRAYGEIFVRRVRSIGIRDRPTSYCSPWQNAYAERLIGSIRRECIDHVVVLGERHLRHVLLSYKDYYNATRTHLSLNKDAPVPRGIECAGNIVCRPILGGLHHQYGRM